MNELIWRTEDEMQAELVTIEDTRDFNMYGRDGHVLAATGEFEYKGMKYTINVLRYYILANPKESRLDPEDLSNSRVSKFCPMGMRNSEYFANLEYPESMREVVATVHLIRKYSNDFLFEDSLHLHQDMMNLDEQIADMHKEAKIDIDSLPELPNDIDKQIASLEEVKRKISTMKIYGG